MVKELARVINRTHHFLADYGIKCSKRSLTGMRKWKKLFESFESGKLPDQGPEDMGNGVEEVLLKESTTLHRQFLLFQEQITESEKLLSERLQSNSRFHNMHKNLSTIPGVGLIISGALIGCLGKTERFKSGRHTISYLGLCPRVHESGGKSLSSGGISKRGNSRLRGYFTFMTPQW